MRALVTGGNGFLGSNLVKFLSEQKEITDIISVGQSQLKRPEFLNERYCITDLRNFDFCRLLFMMYKPDWVFDFASILGGFEFINSSSAIIMHDSTVMNLNVLDAAREYGAKKVLFASSACVYSRHIDLLKEENAYPINPENAYGLQKIFMENLYTEYAIAYGIEVFLPRFQNIYGPYIPFSGPRAKGVADICRKIMLADKFVLLKGNGKQIRDYTYSTDAMEGVWRLIHSNFHEPLNISSGNGLSVDEYARVIMRVLGKNLEIRYDNEFGKGIFRRVSSNDLAKKVIHWKPTTSLEEGISAMIDYIEKEIAESKI